MTAVADQPVTLETALDASRKANERYNSLRGQLEAMGHVPGGGELDLDRLTFLKGVWISLGLRTERHDFLTITAREVCPEPRQSIALVEGA